MTRRTLALAGVAALVVGVSGLAGPAAADPGVSTAPQGAVQVNEIGADLSIPLSFQGDFIELRNTNTSSNFPLTGYRLDGCNSTSAFEIVVFDTADAIPAGEHFLVADDDYASGSGPTRDRPFGFGTTDSPDLEQSAGGVAMVEIATSEVVHSVQWGASVPQACSTYDAAEDINGNPIAPDDDETINYDRPSDAWLLDNPPTPTSSTS